MVGKSKLSKSKLSPFSIMLAIIRIIFLPLKLAHRVIYGLPAPVVVGYCCYTEAEYEKMVKASEDEEEKVGFRAFEEWREFSPRRIKEMEAKRWVVIRINIRTAEVLKWLRESGLKNTIENREKYASHRINELQEKGI